MHYKIKEHEGLVKDSKTGAILLKDKSVSDEYQARKSMMRTNHDLKTELNTLKNEMAELKELLAKIVKDQ